MCMNGLLVVMAFGPLFGLWPSSFFVLPRCWCSLSTHFIIQLGEVLINSLG